MKPCKHVYCQSVQDFQYYFVRVCEREIVTGKNARFCCVFFQNLRCDLRSFFFFCGKLLGSVKSQSHEIVPYALSRRCLTF